MNFMDAVENMINGKSLIRPSWNGYHAVIIPNSNYIWNVPNLNERPIINVGIYTPSINDIYADDWLIKVK